MINALLKRHRLRPLLSRGQGSVNRVHTRTYAIDERLVAPPRAGRLGRER